MIMRSSMQCELLASERMHHFGKISLQISEKPSSLRSFCYKPINEVLQYRGLVSVKRRQCNITFSRHDNFRKRRDQPSGRQIGLKDRQWSNPYAKTVNHRLKGDEEMVKHASPLFGAVGQTGTL
jgi:hypothetical protein